MFWWLGIQLIAPRILIANRLFVWLLSLACYSSFLPFSLPRIRLTQTNIGFSLFGSNPSRTYSFVLLALILYYISFPVPFLHTYQPPVISHSSPPFFCFRRKGSSSILFPYCLSCLTLYTSICLVGACVWFP